MMPYLELSMRVEAPDFVVCHSKGAIATTSQTVMEPARWNKTLNAPGKMRYSFFEEDWVL